jgi:hypothetical protein
MYSWMLDILPINYPCRALALDLTWFNAWQTWQWLYTVSHPTAVEYWRGILPAASIQLPGPPLSAASLQNIEFLLRG